MYKRPKSHKKYKSLVKQELEAVLSPGKAKEASSLAYLLLDVELGLELLSFLGLEQEPIVTVWVLLSGMYIRDERLLNLSRQEKRAIANLRILIGMYGGRFAWEDDLRRYMREIPKELRKYDFNANDLDSQLLGNCLNSKRRFKEADPYYKECLDAVLTSKTYPRIYAEANRPYEFWAKITNIEARRLLSLQFPKEAVKVSKNYKMPFARMSNRRERLIILRSHLEQTAQFIDKIEAIKKLKRGNWGERLEDVLYQEVTQDGAVIDTDTVILDGFLNLAGMVGSGKSTLSTLLAAYLVYRKRCPEAFPELNDSEKALRVTIVLGDTASCIELANQFNLWFCDSPEEADVVAVPLIGKSRRDEHLRELHEAMKYQKEGTIHWGERWLNPTCPLQALLDIEELPHPIIPGHEPCVLDEPPTKEEKAKYAKQGKQAQTKKRLCPLFAKCPSHQRWHDMPKAQVWITTPGGMGSGSLPQQLESRHLHIGDIVYEQSDIVVFDESDTVMEWFDRLYAQEVKLADGGNGNGLLDNLHRQIPPYWARNRNLEAPTSRWVQAQNASIIPLSHVLKQLNQYPHLQKWLSRGYFTAHSLFYKLARRLLGLKEFEDSRNDKQRQKNEEAIQPIIEIFEALKDGDLLFAEVPENYQANKPIPYDTLLKKWKARNKAIGRQWDKLDEEYNAMKAHIVYGLVNIMQSTMNIGDSTQNEIILERYKTWIKGFIPNIQERIENLHIELGKNKNEHDEEYRNELADNSIDDLTKRLELACNASLLDRHTRIIFYEWQNRPSDVIRETQPYGKTPRNLQNILSLPAIGRLFGIYYWSGNDSSANKDVLASFAYTNIGREYLLNFHNMRYWLEEIDGPHVIAMSGTSFLPDSTKWHLGGKLDNSPSLLADSAPKALLKPSEKNSKAIAKSTFTYQPMFGKDGKPIRISGITEKKVPIVKLAEALVGTQYDSAGKFLAVELERLAQEAQREVEQDIPVADRLWQDRARLLLLVNSYDQSKWMADTIKHYWGEKREKIYYLWSSNRKTPNSDTVIMEDSRSGEFSRVDIERFAQTGGEILIAPLSAIGRGFNILNQHGQAAFGAIYFLTRPMPHPQDIPAIAQELNRRHQDWYDDPDFVAWKRDGIYQKGLELRRQASYYWTLVESRSYYRDLWDMPNLHMFPRRDIAATTIGKVVQAVGRLLRGGVPFHGFFTDAAWAPKTALVAANQIPDTEKDTPKFSLLAAMIEVLADYVDSEIGEALYKPLLDSLDRIENFDWVPDKGEFDA